MIPTNDLVTVVKAGSLDDWGRPTGSTTETFKARVDYISEVVKDANGENQVSRATILIKGVSLVTTNDTIQWSDAFGDHEAKPLSVSPMKDLSSKVIFTKVVV